MGRFSDSRLNLHNPTLTATLPSYPSSLLPSSPPFDCLLPSTSSKRSVPSSSLAPVTSPTAIPSAKRVKPMPAPADVPPAVGKLQQTINDDVLLLKRLGWEKFIQHKRRYDDFNDLDNINHRARQLLRQYKFHGAPAIMQSQHWSKAQLDAMIQRGAHKSCYEHLDFLEEEFLDMIEKGQWLVLPYKVVRDLLPNLRLSPPGVVPQRNRRPRWIGDYSWSGVNEDTVPLAPTHAMQFGNAIHRILRHLLLANPIHGPVSLSKFDIADGFYRIKLNARDIPTLGVVFPSKSVREPLVALPLVLPMGWVNSPPIFCAATETAADLANNNLRLPSSPLQPHHLDTLASSIPIPDSTEWPSRPSMQSPTVGANDAASSPGPPPTADPSLRHLKNSLQYIDVYMDDFVALAQPSSQQHVRTTLLHAIDTILRPLSPDDPLCRREPVSMKKLLAGDCTWSTIKLILGWLIDTVNLTISLPPHRVARLQEILDSVPPSQKRISVKKWHKVLGELRSMSLALPGAKHLFSHMQEALSHRKGHRIALKKGVHAAIKDFQWLANNIASRPTRIPEIIPLLPSVLGDHDASKDGAGGILFPAATVNMRQPHQHQHIIIWRAKWPQDIINNLVTSDNPHGTVTINDLELAGGLLHLDAAVHNFDVRERTVLTRTDNNSSLFWQRKGSTTTTACPAYLLRLFGIHQRYHRYVPRHDYLPGQANVFADPASRLFHLSDSDFLDYFTATFPQKLSYRLWTPRKQTFSAVISALRRKTSRMESALVAPAPPVATGDNGSYSQTSWPSIPFSKPSKTKYPSSKCSRVDFEPDNYPQANIPYALERLRITYGQLAKRSSSWA